MKHFPRLGLGIAVLLALQVAGGAAELDDLRRGFQEPPDAARPLVRWWWFGPAVVREELARELQAMKAGGFGGFEIQPTYPLALDGEYPGLRNIRFLSPEFLDLLGYAGNQAAELGLRADLTLGSGWPFGGPMFSRAEAAQSIRDGGTVTLAPGQATVAPPPAPAGRHGAGDGPVVAALLGPLPGATRAEDRYLPLPVVNGEARLPADRRGATQVRFVVSAPADLMQVKRPAFGAEGFIVDHYSRPAVDKFIAQVAQPEIAAFGARPPYSIFCDSLEIAGEGWTPDFPAEFRQRRGYDLVPLLPALFDADFPGAAEIRADYGRTVAEVFNANFVVPLTALAHAHHTRFRLQAYGTPPTTLSTYAQVDIDEGENSGQRAFSGTRWAASASHLLGRAVTSSEAFTWLHSPVFMAAPVDIKAESNLQFLNGVNQLLYHGWPYDPPGVPYPGWRFYAAAVFNDRNPWWLVMPEINRYLTRTGYLLRQGAPANDVALYLPEEDGFARMTPRALELVAAGGRGILNALVSPVIPPILDAGLNYDFVDDGLLLARGQVGDGELLFGDSHYRAVVLPGVTRIPLPVYRALADFARAGGLLVAVRGLPERAPGYRATAADHAAVQALSAELFSAPGARGVQVADEAALEKLLAERLGPDVHWSGGPRPELGAVHRHLAGGELYFLANTSERPVTAEVTVRAAAPRAEWWEATSGRQEPADVLGHEAGRTRIAVTLPAYGTKFLVLGPGAAGSPRRDGPAAELDLSADWEVSFRNAAGEANPPPRHYATLVSWTGQEDTRYFSGVARYEKTLELPADLLAAGAAQRLDFGPGQPEKVAGGQQGFRASYQPPIGDAAVVYVNDQRAGAIWCPPYQVDVTGLLHPGENRLRIEVANRASNYLADRAHHPLPDYTRLNADPRLGGNRFQPQDLGSLEPTPSGLLGRVQLQVLRP